MEEQKQGGTSYSNIFKTTFLFSFVQMFYIFTRVAVNKVIAVLLGAEGLGIISLYNTAINMLKSGCGLGIKQSAVRDVAEANENGDTKKIATVISVTNKVVYLTALLGLIVTIVGSPFLSKYSFGSKEYVIPFIIISIAVALNIYAEGQMAILTGMRRLHDLARANVIGSLVGALSSIPLYFIGGKDGIVPSLIISALCSFGVTKYYVHKIKIERIKLSFKDVFKSAKPMVQMGSVLMVAGFAGLAFDLLISSYIRYEGGFDMVGYFQAGSTIITGYFGIVLTAMTTDYYPRICGVNKDNDALKIEMNKQIASGVILIYPLAVCFIYLAPYFISFLYSGDFGVSVQYTDFAIFGTIIIVASNCMGMIFMAKMESKIYLSLVLIILSCQLCVYLPLYHYYGLRGLGIAYIMNGIISLIIYGVILFRKYRITLNRGNYILLTIVLGTLVITLFARNIPIRWISNLGGSFILIITSIYTYLYLKKNMSIDIITMVKNKFVNN